MVTALLASADSLAQELVAIDSATGIRRVIATPGTVVDEATITLEEKLRRERARELATGVTRYQWAGTGTRLLVPMGDGLWVLDSLDAPARLVVAAADVDGPILDARLSRDGRWIGYVAGDEVWVADADGAAPPVPVTSGAAGTGRTNGLAEFVAQEELGRSYGFWLSPDATSVAFCAVDDTHIPRYRIMHQGSNAVGDAAQEDHAYPFAGAANATVRVGVTAADGSTLASPTWLDLDATDIGADRYVARVDWAPDGTVWVQLLSRNQQRLDLVRYDATTGAGTLVLTERSDVWVNLHDDLRFLNHGRFVWSSERSGYRHLSVHDASGAVLHALTSGTEVVTGVDAVDATHVWFTATTARALERHLFRVPLDASHPPVQLSADGGVHHGVVHAASGAVVDRFSSPTTPPRTELRAGDVTTVLHDAADDPAVADADLAPPEELVVTADDGTALHALVYRPAGAGPHPTIVSVYGGPHAQMITRSWGVTVALRAQYLRQCGFCVAVVDNRGSTDRGLAFEAAISRAMGTVEVDDQVALVAALVADGTTDPTRVGIYGWSYGGFMALMSLATRPDVFAAACAGAPVTDWDGYDTAYTERYMGTPADNAAGYEAASVLTHVEGLRDKPLLLVHGLIDENVHFRHTARLINALIHADIDYELLLFPDERHSPRFEPDRAYMESRIARFFGRALTP